MKSAVLIEKSITLLLACLENLFHGGVIFGWPSLLFILIQNGYFAHLCDDTRENKSFLNVSRTISGNDPTDSPTTTCPEQEGRLQLVYSLAVASQTLCMFPLGYFFDRFGTRLSRILLSFLLILGYFLTGFSSPEHPFLLFPGTISFTIGGSLLLFTTMQVGNVFKERKSTVISLMNAMYSSSTIVFIIAKALYVSGLSIRVFFIILALSVVLLNINTFFIFPVKHIPWPYPDGHRLITCCSPETGQAVKDAAGETDGVGEDVEGKCNQGYLPHPGESGDDGDNSKAPDELRETDGKDGDEDGHDDDDSGVYSGGRSEGGKGQGADRGISDIEFDSIADNKGNGACSRGSHGNSVDRSFEDQKIKQYPTFRACILSAPFWLILLWLSSLQLHLYFIFGAVNFFLNRLTDNNESLVSRYTDGFAIIQTCVFFTGPLGGLLMDRNKLVTLFSTTKTPKARDRFADMRDSCIPLAVTTLCAIGFSVCLLIPSLPLQYLTFIFILLMRSLLFGVGAAVTTVVFPMKFFASVYGACRTISGFISFLQYPVFFLIQNYFRGDPFWMVIAFIIADCATLLLPIFLYIKSKGKSSK